MIMINEKNKSRFRWQTTDLLGSLGGQPGSVTAPQPGASSSAPSPSPTPAPGPGLLRTPQVQVHDF